MLGACWTRSTHRGGTRAERREQATADTRGAIVAAARSCLLADGYANLSTRRVADAAEVPLSQIHYHFGSKRQLILAVLGPRPSACWSASARCSTRPNRCGSAGSAPVISSTPTSIRLRPDPPGDDRRRLVRPGSGGRGPRDRRRVVPRPGGGRSARGGARRRPRRLHPGRDRGPDGHARSWAPRS